MEQLNESQLWSQSFSHTTRNKHKQ